MYPSLKSKINMHKLLRSQGMVVAPSSSLTESKDERIIKYQNYLTKPEPHLRVSKKALTTIATWAENHNRPIVLGELPRSHMLFNSL